MKILVAVSLLLLTAFLFGSGFYLALNDKPNWGYFLGAGIFSFLISAAVSAGLAAGEIKSDDHHEMEG